MECLGLLTMALWPCWLVLIMSLNIKWCFCSGKSGIQFCFQAGCTIQVHVIVLHFLNILRENLPIVLVTHNGFQKISIFNLLLGFPLYLLIIYMLIITRLLINDHKYVFHWLFN
jgi:hypothetical protein